MANGTAATPFWASKLSIVIVGLLDTCATFAAGYVARVSFEPHLGDPLSLCMWFVGLLVTVGWVTMQLRIDASAKLAIQQAVAPEFDSLRNIVTVFNSYHAVVHPDLRFQREAAMKRVTQELQRLTRGEALLEGSDYYRWLNDKMSSGLNMVRAVSCRPLEVYIEDPREINWAKKNEEVAMGGTQITRIFVVEREELVDPKKREVLRQKMLSSKTTNYVVWRDRVSAAIAEQLAGGGFSIYNSDVAFFDRSYFATKVGTTKAMSNSLVPAASLYCPPHAEFDTCERIFRDLEELVPHGAKRGPTAAYSSVLTDLDGFLTKNYGSIQKVDTCLVDVLDGWNGIKEELRVPRTAGL